MTTPQSGIFALGTASHADLELDLLADRSGVELVDAIAVLRESIGTARPSVRSLRYQSA